MTAMPEAALAAEAGLEYAMVGLVVNHAAGRGRAGRGGIHEEMKSALPMATGALSKLLDAFVTGHSAR